MDGWYRKGLSAQDGDPLARQLASCTRAWAWLTAVHSPFSCASIRHTSTVAMTLGSLRVSALISR